MMQRKPIRLGKPGKDKPYPMPGPIKGKPRPPIVPNPGMPRPGKPRPPIVPNPGMPRPGKPIKGKPIMRPLPIDDDIVRTMPITMKQLSQIKKIYKLK